MDGGAIAAIVLSILLVILGLAFGGLFIKYKELESRSPAFIGPRRSWFAWIWQQFAYTRILFMYMPNAILMFGFIADILSQNYRYSSASVLGLSSVFLNGIADMILKKVFSEAPQNVTNTATAAAAAVGTAAAAVAAPAAAAAAAPAILPAAAAAATVAATTNTRRRTPTNRGRQALAAATTGQPTIDPGFVTANSGTDTD